MKYVSSPVPVFEYERTDDKDNTMSAFAIVTDRLFVCWSDAEALRARAAGETLRVLKSAPFPHLTPSALLALPEVRALAKKKAGWLFGLAIRPFALDAFPFFFEETPAPGIRRILMPTREGGRDSKMEIRGSDFVCGEVCLHLRIRKTREPVATWQGGTLFDGTHTPVGACKLPAGLGDYMARLLPFLAPMRAEADAKRNSQAMGMKCSRYHKAMDHWAGVHVPEALADALVALQEGFVGGGRHAPKGILFYGPPGTGKTIIAKKLAEACGVAFFPLSLADLKAATIGQSAQNVRQIWNNARAAGSAIIFVDECEGAFSKRGATHSDSFTGEIVMAFLAEWDGIAPSGHGGGICVIGATNRRDLLDEAVLSRFENEIEIPLPDARCRPLILAREIANSARFAPSVTAETIRRATNGLSGRDLRTVAKKLIAAGTEQIDIAAIKKAVEKVRGRGATQTEDCSWDSVVLDSSTLQSLKTVCGMLENAEVLARQGISLPRAILLHGPPGTGKTQVARTIASECRINFISATTADIKAGFIGQSGQKVKEVFERARSNSPCVLYIDEIDVLAPARGDGDSFTGEIIGQLLQEMDGAKKSEGHVFILASTNRLDSLDSAVVSRFPQRIEIPLPDERGRAEILRRLVNGKPVADIAPAIERIAASSRGLSGRDLRSIVERAEQSAVLRALEAGTADKVLITADDLAKACQPKGHNPHAQT